MEWIEIENTRKSEANVKRRAVSWHLLVKNFLPFTQQAQSDFNEASCFSCKRVVLLGQCWKCLLEHNKPVTETPVSLVLFTESFMKISCCLCYSVELTEELFRFLWDKKQFSLITEQRWYTMQTWKNGSNINEEYHLWHFLPKAFSYNGDDHIQNRNWFQRTPVVLQNVRLI